MQDSSPKPQALILYPLTLIAHPSPDDTIVAMVFSWITKQRRKRLLAEPMPPAWLDYLGTNVRHYAHLSPRRQARLRHVMRIVVAEKNWEGGAGFQVTEEMKVTVAAQAAILTIGQAEPYYFDHVQSIIIYPGPYEHPPEFSGTIVRRRKTVLGESWYRGPIVLSWKETLAAGRNESNGRNLVFHEFAHYLDALDGEVDGTPPLTGRRRQRRWFRVTEAEYLRLVGQARRNDPSLLDHYGATNRAEFFAVATECFFEQPHAMEREYRELYGVLRDFYRQDPARWLPDAATVDENPRVRSARGIGLEAASTETSGRLEVAQSGIVVYAGRGVFQRRAIPFGGGGRDARA